MLPRRAQKRKRREIQWRSQKYLAWIRRTWECVCSDFNGCEGRVEAAHLRIGTDGGTSIKPSDCFVFPCCSGHHQEQHRIGERSFAAKYALDLPVTCKQLVEHHDNPARLDYLDWLYSQRAA